MRNTITIVRNEAALDKTSGFSYSVFNKVVVVIHKNPLA